MRNKVLSTIMFLALIAGAGWYLYRGSSKQAQAPAGGEETRSQAQNQPVAGQAGQQPAATTTTQPSATAPAATTKLNVGGKQLEGTFSAGEGDAAAPNIQVWEVSFDGSKFSPELITINVNDWVFFRNKSTVSFWPASGPHPTHTALPGFDAGKAIAPGGQYKFQFTKPGSWSYHDHLHEDIGGVIKVVQ